MSDLRPCPFCGGPALFFSLVHEKEPMVMCRNDECAAEVGGRTKAAAIAAWNKRTPDYEVKWMELVETIATRTDQRKVTP